MRELDWFTVSMPRDLDLDGVTAVLRVLANRPRLGIAGVTPRVVLEMERRCGEIAWRLGIDSRISKRLPSELEAQLPRLSLQRLPEAERPALTLAADLLMDGMSGVLRIDLAGAVSSGLLAAMRQTNKDEVALLQWIIGPSRRYQSPPAPVSLAEALGLRSPSQPDAASMRQWRAKIEEPLLAVRGRAGAYADSPARAYQIVRSLADAVKLANSTHARLRLGKATKSKASKLVRASGAPPYSCLLSARELAAVAGWPVNEAAGNEDLPLIGGHVNPVPLSLRLPVAVAAERPGVRVLGESLHASQRGELVTVPVKTSLHHLHVVGPTGSGKSNLLASLVLADIAAGRSVLVIEPKGDLVQDVLARMPKHRWDDVVVIEPDSTRSVGLNVLAGPQAQAERRADQIVSLLAEQHGANLGPRSTDIALHALIAISRLKDGTLCDIPTMLTNPAFRRRVLAEVGDPLVISPFFSAFEALSEAERTQHVAPLLNKLRPLTSRGALRHMLGQAAPRFSLEELFTRRRVVLINLNKGSLGAETASLLGSLILNQFWTQVQRRSAVPAHKRHMVAAYIDEVQDYLRLPGVDLGDFFAQARGLGVAMTVAHQHLDQLSPTQRSGILANARSRVVFRPATADAKPLAANMGSGIEGEDLLRLRAFEACCQLLVDSQPTRPFSVRTRPLPPWTSDPTKLRQVSAERYGVDGEELDKALLARWQGEPPCPDSPVGFKRRAAK